MAQFRTQFSYGADDYLYDDDFDYIPPQRKKTSAGGKERSAVPKRPQGHTGQSPPPGAGGPSTSPGKAARSRPTNNQLLYKAYFRWSHYPHKLKSAHLPVETDACASVTAAFLQVLQIMQTAEQLRVSGTKRNVLQILSSNTRRTKVVELSSGTHRVPDELKKHYLSDGEGGQYSTNLDRNRYGNDDNYLFTVIRYDLEFLGLCPCMVDVEIIDAKQGNTSIIVSAGTEVCTCGGVPGPMAGMNGPPLLTTSGGHPVTHLSGGAVPGIAAMAAAAAAVAQPMGTSAGGGGGYGGKVKPEPRLTNSLSQGYAPGPINAELARQQLDTATGPAPGHLAGLDLGPDVGGPGPGPAVPGPTGPVFGSGAFRSTGLGGPMGRESPKRSGTSVSQLFDALVMAATGGADGAAADGLGGDPAVTSPAHADRPDRFGAGVTGGLGTGPRLHGPPGRNKSKLWSLNNLSYGGEVDSLQNALDAFREQDEIASGEPAAFLTSGGGLGSAGGVPGPDGSLQRSDSLRQRRRKPLRNSSILGRPASSGGVIPGMSKMGMNLKEKSDDNLRLAAAAAEAAEAGGGAAAQGQTVSSLASGEDDNDGGLAAKGEEVGPEGEGEGEAVEGGGEAAGGEEALEEDEAGGRRGGGGLDGMAGPTASGTMRASALGRSPLRHHVRHVPRQSSVANLAPRVNHAAAAAAAGGPGGGGSASAALSGEQIRRLANELEVIKAENRSLRQQLQRNGTAPSPGSSQLAKQPQQQQPQQDDRLKKLEAELSAMRAELMGMGGAKKAIDEENRQLKRELVLVHQQMNMVLARVLGAAAGAVGAPTGTPPLNLAALAGMLGGPAGLSAAAEPAHPGLHLAGAAAAMGHGSVNGVGAPVSGGPQVAAPEAVGGKAEQRAGAGAAAPSYAATYSGAAALAGEHGPRKRTAEQAGLGDLAMEAADEAADGPGPQLAELVSLPTLAPVVPGPQPAPSLPPLDSNAATPADSGFSDVAQLLAMPTMESGGLGVDTTGAGGGAGTSGIASRPAGGSNPTSVPHMPVGGLPAA